MTQQAKIITFFAISDNVGKSTLSTVHAYQLAETGAKVLYVEADYVRPNFALATGMSHPQKNMMALMQNGIETGFIHYVASKYDFAAQSNNKVLQAAVKRMPDTLDVLAFPQGFREDLTPHIDHKEPFLEALREQLLELPYQYIVFNVPNEISEMFSYPLIGMSDAMVKVFGSRPGDTLAWRTLEAQLHERKLALPEERYRIFNFLQPDYVIDMENFSGLKIDIAIPFDAERASHEWGMQVGSPIINEKMKDLLHFQDVHVEEEIQKAETRRSFFGLRS